MRHFFAARPVAALSRGMLPPPRPAVLVALSGASKRPPPGPIGALSGTVNLAAVAAAADHHLYAAACAEEQPRRRRLGMRWLNTRWTCATIAGILALHACPARCGARRRAKPPSSDLGAVLTPQERQVLPASAFPTSARSILAASRGRRHPHRRDERRCIRRPPVWVNHAAPFRRGFPPPPTSRSCAFSVRRPSLSTRTFARRMTSAIWSTRRSHDSAVSTSP
jgi:hypothetical protein